MRSWCWVSFTYPINHSPMSSCRPHSDITDRPMYVHLDLLKNVEVFKECARRLETFTGRKEDEADLLFAADVGEMLIRARQSTSRGLDEACIY